MLAAVGEPTRMLILHRLAEKPYHVGLLAEAVGVPMVNISHHLGVMRQAGLLEDDKEGRRVIYSLSKDIYTPGGEPGVIGTFRIGSFVMTLVRSSGGAGMDGTADPASKPGGGTKAKGSRKKSG